MKKRLQIKDYAEGIENADITVLSQAITLVESTHKKDIDLAAEVLDSIMSKTGNSLRLGITGSPGVGKSTFISQFGKILHENHHKIAILTIDPTSSKNRGSILGDKTRMGDLMHLPNVFIRPSPSGTSLGGVARKTREAMLLCEAAGFDFIIIETVGTGQSETAVKELVDYLLLLLPPIGGDELQGIKKGIVELADGIAITKFDGAHKEAAQGAAREYKSALSIIRQPSESAVNVELCSALENTGLDAIYQSISDYIAQLKSDQIFDERRNQQLISWMHTELKFQLTDRFYAKNSNRDRIKSCEKLVIEREISPTGAVQKLIK